LTSLFILRHAGAVPDVSQDPVWSHIRGKVEIAPGVTIFEYGEVAMEDYRGFDVAATVAYNGRRLEVHRLTVSKRADGSAVTGEALRTIAVEDVLRESARHALARGVGAVKIAPTVARGHWAAPDADVARTVGAAAAERLREMGPARETLEAVAVVYRVAEVIGEPPTKAVREAFGISQSTAGAWIGRARSAELVPPVEER
jgi:hypothetical protein